MKLDLKSMLVGALLAAVCVIGSLAATSPPPDGNEVGRYVPYPHKGALVAVLDTRTGGIYTVTEIARAVTNPVEGVVRVLEEMHTYGPK